MRINLLQKKLYLEQLHGFTSMNVGYRQGNGMGLNLIIILKMHLKRIQMTKTVPFKSNYDLVKIIDKYANIILYVSTGIVLLAFVTKSISESFIDMVYYILKLNCILIIAYLISDLIKDYLLFNARKKKRLDLIDNALGTSLTTEHSLGYFSNENIEPGIYKLAVNGFENTLFSLYISKAVLPRMILLNAAILFVFLSSVIYGLNNIVVLIIQLVLPAVMLQQIIKQVLYVNYLDNVYHKYCAVFNDLKNGVSNSYKISEMLSNILEYESTLAWANILLSETKNNELNPSLSEKWEKIKENYKIE